MVKFITQRIEEAANRSREEGEAKYDAYFINTHIYARYRNAVDENLISDGYEYIIPVE